MNFELFIVLVVSGCFALYYLCEAAFCAVFKYKHGKCPHKWKLVEEYERTLLSGHQSVIIVDRCTRCGELNQTEL